MSLPVWTDSHCHLQDVADPDGALERARGAGVTRLVCIGTDAAQSRRALAFAGDGVWATIGLHPHEAKEGVEDVVALLEKGVVSSKPAVVAVGECGLDYHYEHSPRLIQREAFAAQIALAHRYGLALVVHSREAWDDTLAVLQSEGVPDRTVFHCFTGGPAEARRCLDLGGFLSFSGIVTFKGAGDVREAAALCPAERLLVETDSPFLAPVPYRGKPNEPAFVPLVGTAVAETRGEAPADGAASTWAATAAAFGLPLGTP
ncbi:MAG TPA: TatD family hydrolase [Acidimicrobiales bacterium]|nr:TatD family hydrolase [Acidimicrobiales bacterium]